MNSTSLSASDPEDDDLVDRLLDYDSVRDSAQATPQLERVDTTAPRIKYLDFDEISKEGIPPMLWIIMGWLAVCDIALIGGPGGVGKSTLIAALALSIATGRPWCGIPPTRTGKVLVFDEEQSFHDLARLYLRSGAKGVENLKVSSLQGINMATDEGAALVAKEIKRERPLVVILDSATQVFVGIDENAAKEVAPVFRRLSHLASEFQVSFVIVHHLKKPSENSSASHLNMIRGSTVWGTQASTVWTATAADGDAIDLVQVKRRGSDKQRIRVHYSAEEGEQGAITLTGEPLSADSETPASGERVYETLLRHLRERGHAKRRELVALLAGEGMTESAADQAVGRAVNLGKSRNSIERTGQGTYRIVEPDLEGTEESDDDRE
ncbi:MAG: AAA family ATPase [Planctomycetes bacterium]|nr:AAA family ATPase [Planctomycetota bacterium]